MPREPRPIQFEPGPMPANDSLRLDKDQCPPPSRPQPPQDHPEQFVRCGKTRLRVALPQNRKLLPQGQILQDQVAARGQEVNSQYRKKPQQTQHEISFTRGSFIMDAPFNYLIRRQIVILASHRSETSNRSSHRLMAFDSPSNHLRLLPFALKENPPSSNAETCLVIIGQPHHRIILRIAPCLKRLFACSLSPLRCCP